MNKVYQIITSVKLDPASKAYKKAIAKSRGMLTGSPDIYQTTGKFVDKKADQGLTSGKTSGSLNFGIPRTVPLKLLVETGLNKET